MHKNRLNKLSLFLILSSYSSLSLSSTSEDFFDMSLNELMEIEVYTASQEKETAAESPATISVITAKQLNEWGITSLHDAISLLPGTNKSQSYLGQTTQTFRGVNPGLFNNKSLYLVNGHPSYESLFGSTLIDYIPIEIIERIEVVRSPASVLYGTNAISGVINIITKQGVDLDDMVSVRGGSNGHKYGSYVHHSKNLSMAASVQRDDGYDYTGATDEFGNEVDDKHHYDLENIFIDGYGEDWRINAAFFDREQFLYGVNPWVWHNGNFETYVGYVDANKSFEIETGELNVWLRYDVSDKDIHVGAFPYPADVNDCRAFNIPATVNTPMGPMDPCLAGNPSGQTDTASTVINKVERTSIEVQFKDRITDELNYIVGATFEEQKSDPLMFIYDSDGSVNRPAFPDKQETETTAIYTQFKYQPTEDTILIAGVRGEDNSESDESDLMPRIGITHQIIPDTYLKFLYSEAFRTPMFIEKYVQLAGVLIGDEDLKRETIETFEVGIDSRINDNNSLQLSIYTIKLDDEILRFPDPNGTPAAVYLNGGGKEVTGMEAEWKSILSDEFEMILNAAHITDSNDASLGESDAPYTANDLANLILTYHASKNLNFTISTQYVGEKDTVIATTGEESSIDSYQLVNLSGVYSYNKHQLRVMLHNITEEEYTYTEPVRRLIDDIPGGNADTSAYVQYTYSF